ncbi:antifreeze protein [Rubrivirga marina]|uniref:Antifreeze protein n=2 Tax=Rubrivirga marina TaxID=1196024 RepID=A0A271IY20_9BACT|nr:antifreeze protein [Rubrivirga marina]
MGLMDRLRGELIDIVEWTDTSRDTLAWKFPRHQNEIKSGAKLVVREGQAAVFVDQGQLADVFDPGTYTLDTANLPILSTIEGWKYGFESPFKAEVFFVNTRRFPDQKWGTKNPIMLRDPEFGPTRLRAFGTYAFRVSDPATFLETIVGTSGDVDTGAITDQIRNILVARFTDVLGESKLAALDMAANVDELGGFVAEKMADDMDEYGIEVLNLLVENVSLPPAVEQALDQRTSMGVIGDLGAYTQYQTAQAIGKAAENPGGAAAAAGVGLGAGLAMANQMGAAMTGGQAQPQQASAPSSGAPPPPPDAASFHVSKDGQSTGPFGLDALRQQARSGDLTRESFVWSQSLGEWKKAGDVDALRPVFDATPPPPPDAA